jgi:hypothetical protein
MQLLCTGYVMPFTALFHGNIQFSHTTYVSAVHSNLCRLKHNGSDLINCFNVERRAGDKDTKGMDEQ